MIFSLRHLLAGATLAILAGCASLPLPGTVTPAARPHAARFELAGRIAATDGERSANGPLHWQHSTDQDIWTLSSPLGQIVARVVRTPAGAWLETSRDERHEAADVQTLISHLLGVQAPAASLPYWVQALPAPGARVLRHDPQGRPAVISDQGWLVEYVRYQSDAADAAPRRIDAHWADNRLRLIIDRWTPDDAQQP